MHEVAAEQEAKRMIKSFVALASCKLRIFVLVNSPAMKFLVPFFQQTKPRGVEVVIRLLDEKKFEARATVSCLFHVFASIRENTEVHGSRYNMCTGMRRLQIFSDHHSSIFGMAKHFVVDIFPSLRGTFIVADIDMIFGADICLGLPKNGANTWGTIHPCCAVLFTREEITRIVVVVVCAAVIPVHGGWKGSSSANNVCRCD